ncbi:MAG: hypothetical protein ACFB10_07580 [Salibacteraceae bacterium]
MLQKTDRLGKGSGKDKVVWQTHNRDWHWAYNWMLGGFFFGLFSLVIAGGQTLVSAYFLARVVVFCCLAGLVIPVKWYNRWWKFGTWEALMFNLLGVGPTVCGLLLCTNLFFHGSAITETLRVEDIELSRSTELQAKLLCDLEGDAWQAFPKVREVALPTHPNQVAQIKKLRITTAEGALGYPIWISTTPIMD